jgi:hypothetical protein
MLSTKIKGLRFMQRAAQKSKTADSEDVAVVEHKSGEDEWVENASRKSCVILRGLSAGSALGAHSDRKTEQRKGGKLKFGKTQANVQEEQEMIVARDLKRKNAVNDHAKTEGKNKKTKTKKDSR